MFSLEDLWKSGKDYLGVEYAILGGAMSWVSEANLVSAVSNAGAFGVLACSAMSVSGLQQEIEKTKKLTSASFGVNLIVMHPELDKLVDCCIEEKVKHVVLAGGIPSSAIIEKLNKEGIRVMAFAPALSVAKRLIKMGVSSLVIEGSEAGGHIGNVSTSVLAQEILPNIKEVPVFVAGGIGRGDAIVNYLFEGASGAQLGTIFACSKESIAHEKFKQSFIRASAKDAQPSIQLDPQFKVIPVRALVNNATKEFAQVQLDAITKFKNGEITKEQAQLEIEHYWAGALKRAVIDGDIENGSLMAGQSVGMVNDIKPVKDIIEDLIFQANAHLEKIFKLA